ncbi:MAG: hydrogenase expression/formation protein HypE [Desulfobacterales bacterium]
MTDRILLDHGSGGKISHALTAEVLLPLFQNPILAELNDGAVFDLDGARLAFSTDTFTVDPLFFPGGNIGDLAVNGTVNDVAMCGAEPLFLSLGLVIEEGFPMAELKTILGSIRTAADSAGVQIVTGDTKVVPRGAADRIFINTSGIGRILPGVRLSSRSARPGDRILLSGTIADHGMTILSRRQGLEFDTPIESDSAPLNQMVMRILEWGNAVHVLRDPTRGGVGTTLNEIAESSGVGILIHEDRIPIREAVSGLCELLGFDPLYVANEGKLLAFVAPDAADAVLDAIRSDPHGRDARMIGEVVGRHPGRVVMATRIGGERIVDMLAGEQLPRIC